MSRMTTSSQRGDEPICGRGSSGERKSGVRGRAQLECHRSSPGLGLRHPGRPTIPLTLLRIVAARAAASMGSPSWDSTTRRSDPDSAARTSFASACSSFDVMPAAGTRSHSPVPGRLCGVSLSGPARRRARERWLGRVQYLRAKQAGAADSAAPAADASASGHERTGAIPPPPPPPPHLPPPPPPPKTPPPLPNKKHKKKPTNSTLPTTTPHPTRLL